MIVLGLSGFDRSVAYKRSLLGSTGSAEERLCQGMDAAAAILVDGRVVAAAAEERFDLRKHSNRLPVEAIRYCLREAGVTLEDVDRVAHGFDYSEYRRHFALFPAAQAWYDRVFAPEVVREDLTAAFGRSFDPARFVPVRHHLAHAASSYRLSGYDRALVVVADGMGEVHGLTVFEAEGAGPMRTLAEIPYTSSIGLLYGLVTMHLGFEFNSDEYKTMGLAPYGDPARFRPALDRWVRRGEGGFTLDYLAQETTDLDRETYRGTRRRLAETFFPPRAPDEPLRQEHKDLAAAVQRLTNDLVLETCRTWAEKTRQRRVCLAGGVALNCVANQQVAERAGIDALFVQPASGDDGVSLGAAAETAASLGDRIEAMRMPYWGPCPDEGDLRAAAASAKVPRLVEHPDDAAAAERLARLAAAGKVVALFQGRMEFGPRALGNRSILADPRPESMRERVNAAVKKREAFRPFAPAVTEEAFAHFFESPAPRLPYMLVTVRVRPEWRARLAAVTHLDGSARVQTVARSDNPLLHEALEAFGRLSGFPILLNTSFNVKGQPIVRTAGQAVETFLGTAIDALFLGRRELAKDGCP